MKHLKFFALGIFVLFTAALLATGAFTAEKSAQPEESQTAKIEWLSFDQGLAALKEKDNSKHMFVDITASWCGWCKKMDRETFTDPRVIELMNTYFIPVKLWGDSNKELDIDGYKISEKNLAVSEFKVSGYPTFWFVNPDQARIGPMPGYQTADRMVKALTWVKDREYDTTATKDTDKGKQSGK